jgi:uncharacterized protein DUF5317
MLLVGAILGIGLLIGWGLGGALRNLGLVRINWWPALPAALALQGVPIPQLEGEVGRLLPFAVLLLSYAVLIAVLVVNWRLRGFLVVLAGLVLNLVPIVANQGMPVSGTAIESVGGSLEDIPRERGEKHHLATDEDIIQPLADVIAVRDPFNTVVSVGDVLMYAGAAVFLAAAMMASPERPPRRDFARSRPARPSTMSGSPR